MQAHASNPEDAGKKVAWYIADEDLRELDLDPEVHELFVKYSHLPPEAVRAHVLKKREEAWKVYPYPCIGRLRFLDFSLARMPSYDEILARLRDPAAPARLLDVGCCFAQNLRRLVADGAPSENLVGLDIESQFLSLSYDLFADREFFKGQLLAGDIFDESPGGPVALLQGTIHIIHAASFFHLFSWDDQVKAGIQLVHLMKNAPDALVLGRHRGSLTAEESPRSVDPSGKVFVHSPDSFKKLWGVISEHTGTNWEVNAWLEEAATHLHADQKQAINNRIQLLLHFEVRRTHG